MTLIPTVASVGMTAQDLLEEKEEADIPIATEKAIALLETGVEVARLIMEHLQTEISF
jgi:hypothetical protein